MLAAIYDRLGSVTANTDIQFDPIDASDARALAEKVQDLRKMIS